MSEYPTNDYLLNVIKKGAEDALGLPLGVQVVGLPWNEELVLYAMKELELEANFKMKYKY